MAKDAVNGIDMKIGRKLIASYRSIDVKKLRAKRMPTIRRNIGKDLTAAKNKVHGIDLAFEAIATEGGSHRQKIEQNRAFFAKPKLIF